jgi:hypothetical protein
MVCSHHQAKRCQSGAILVLSMIFLAVFSALAIAVVSLSDLNLQVAVNHHKGNLALYAAQSGLECSKYLVNTVTLTETGSNVVSDTEADEVWTDLFAHIQGTALDGKSVGSPTRFTDAVGSGDQIAIIGMDLGDSASNFSVRFYRYDSDKQTIRIQSIGTAGLVARQVHMGMDVTKDSDVLNYAIASRGRMWLTGDTTIHGDIFSAWDRPEISPYNMTSDSAVDGTINTVLSLEQINDESYQMESLNGDGLPIDGHGDPIGENYDDRYYSWDDEIQGYHEGINYDQPYQDMPGMDIGDYDTDSYTSGLSTIASCPSGDREVEYFPHASGNYNAPRDGSPNSTWNRKLTRHVYEDQTLTDALLPTNRNALFRNCTFEGVLYIDCAKSTSSYYNNVRFENCVFNGVIVTDVPQSLKWKHNALYFTGPATFDNQSAVQEATILAPHFNVNLGNTNPQQSDNNVLTGAIVGGIVDVRGNAQIYGTIISMCDTTQWSSGYVTNIGATLDDGGSETTELGDIGVIEITPEEDKLLPSGITSPIIIKPQQNTYSEGV